MKPDYKELDKIFISEAAGIVELSEEKKEAEVIKEKKKRLKRHNGYGFDTPTKFVDLFKEN